MSTTLEHDVRQCEGANASGRTPVVFIHGLWLLPSSWDRWASVFEEAGYAPLTQGEPRRAAHIRPVSLRLCERRQRRRGQGAVRDLCRAGVRRAALSGGERELQPVDGGKGGYKESRPRTAPDP